MLGQLSEWFPSLVKFIRRQPGCKDYHINGFVRMGEEHNMFIVAAGLCSYLAEGCLLVLMKDSRLPLLVDQVEATMDEELAFLSTIPDPVWDLIAEPLETLSAARLKSRVLTASRVQVAFITHKTLAPAKSLPWSLCGGDVASKLEALKAGPEPEQATAKKIYMLEEMGYPREKLIEGVACLGDCPWTILSTEEQHASVKLIGRNHLEYTLEMLILRAFLHTLRRIMPSPSPEELQLQKQAKTRRGVVCQEAEQHLWQARVREGVDCRGSGDQA